MTAMLAAGALLLPALAWAVTTRTVELSNSTADETQTMKAFDAPATALGDFDGDGKPELVAHNDNQYVYVLSSTSPHVYAEFRPDYPSGWGVRPINDPAVADVDGDGKLEIVVVNSAAFVCVYEYAGASGDRFSFTKRWCDRMDAYGATAADAGAWVEDVDGDGKMEIFSQTETKGLFAYNHDGSARWSKDTFGGNAGPVVSDLDQDGRKEVVFFGDGGEVKAYDASSGSSRWAFFASNHVKPASIPLAGNAADLDGDGKEEVVFIARDAHDATNLKNNHFMLFVLGSNGQLKWKVQPTWAHPMSYSHIILEDLDGDGHRDILGLDWNTMGHKPGNWEELGPSHVFAYRGTGTLLWMTEIKGSWTNDDLVLADVDGDGAHEILALGYGPSGDGVWYLDARTGAKETHVPISGWTPLRGPVAGDLDGTGMLSWAIPLHRSALGGAFHVYRTDAPCREAGAFLGWQNHHGCGDGNADTGGDTGGTTPPPTTEQPFDVTFRTEGGNEWWVAVKLSSSLPVNTVEARVDGGAWHNLPWQSWGEWAASIHAPDGSLVEFRATATTGEQKVSGAYRWPDGTPTTAGDGTGGGAGGGTLDVAFVNVKGNEWWLQVDVIVHQGSLMDVQARVNGGAWTTLDLKSWGSWAKSMHAPPGSHVEFLARATDGATRASGVYVWPPA